MSSILKTTDWGRSTLLFLSQLKTFDSNQPAVIHMRHSMWPMNSEFPDLTEDGIEAAYEYGTLLPKNKNYRIFHTPRNRTEQTANQIVKGLALNGVKVESVKPINLSYSIDSTKGVLYHRRERDLIGIHQSFFYSWIGGRYPPHEILPLISFARNAASLTLKNLETAKPDTIDIYVSHEYWVAAFLYAWFGLEPINWVPFLDGFLFQSLDERMKVLYRGRSIELYYPYWWQPNHS